MDIEDFTDIPFLFYIHFPIDSSVGVIMMYKTSARSMNREVKSFIKSLFSFKGFTVRYRPFISKNQKKEFESFSTVEKIVISQNVRGGDMDDPYEFFDTEKKYKVKIEVSEINEPTNKFLKSIKKKISKANKDNTQELFPEFKDAGIDKDNADIKTYIKEKGGSSAKADFEDYDSYLEKLLPKITLKEKSTVEYGNSTGVFIYDELLSELNSILKDEVIPTLNETDES
ncbi:hypothetical protein [Brumimicrobium sp.]|uniref:hypothetical protein n=1 Tax=Brumimicrobium sp. TaxID=2029867 RepID=UPI003A93D143